MNAAAASPLIAGIDGGGTNTRAILTTIDGAVLATGSAGPANLQSEGQPATLQALLSALDGALAAHPGQSARREDLVAVGVGLAGAHLPGEREHLVQVLRTLLPRAQVTVWTDADVALAAGLGAAPGIVVIAGTGSIALGTDASGTRARSGGWGYLIGDEGSAYAIARHGLQLASHGVDGRAAPSLLATRLARAFSEPDFDHLLHHLYGPPPLSRRHLARLAPLVAECALAGDPAALTVLHAAAADLAQMVVAVAAQLRLSTGPFPVVCTGGVWLAGPVIGDPFAQRLAGTLPQATLAAPVLTPVGGAALLALQSLGDLPPQPVRLHNLRKVCSPA